MALCARQWDKDGGGALNYSELSKIMRKKHDPSPKAKVQKAGKAAANAAGAASVLAKMKAGKK